MVLLFILGIALGAVPLGWLCFREKKRSSEYLERAQLAQQEKLIVVDFMHGMVEAMGEGLDKEELFQRIVHASVVSTGALSACVHEKGEDGMLRSVAVEGLFPPHRPLPYEVREKHETRAKFLESALRLEEFRVGDGVIGKVAQTGRSIMVENGRNDPRIVKHDDPALAIVTAICAPIRFQGEVLGVLSVCNTADGLPFSDTDRSVVESLSEQAGMAIHNSDFLTLQLERKQIDVDLKIARSVQQMLLPQNLPVFEGVEMDARYVSSHTVGGDFYDVFELGPRVFGMAIADVSGKGIPGSILMAICRTNLRLYAKGEVSPAAVLKKVNSVMVGEMKEGMYITVLYAIVDLDRDEIVYARAGHERPLLCRVESGRDIATVSYPESEGMPVGLVASELFDDALEERKVPFVKGDLFVAYTDGLTETANSLGKEFSSARLADVVKNSRRSDPAEINEGVFENLERFSGKRHYDDDLTFLTIKRV